MQTNEKKTITKKKANKLNMKRREQDNKNKKQNTP